MTADQIYRYMQAPEKLNQETLPLLKELTVRYPAFEAGWILYLKNLKNLNDSSFEQELVNGALRIQDRRKLYLILNEKSQKTDSGEEPSASPADSGDLDIYNLIFAPEYRLDESVKTDEPMGEIARSIQEQSGKRTSLIEKFLEAQPKMPPVKEKEPNSPVDNNKQSDEGNDDPVTETLATIYAQQGYYKKAIQIFEKLSLKYPEKSTYFAGHIEKIKNLMNN
jgi:tetratricopeptide (TPR) repeat protein